MSKKDFADLHGVSRAAVTQAAKRGSIDEHDGGIQIDGQKTLAWAEKRKKRVQRTEPDVKSEMHKSQDAFQANTADINSAMGKLELERRKLAASAHQIELKNAQMEKRLVSRDMMCKGVWNPLETFLVRLLTDGAKTITSTAYALIRSGIESETRGEQGVTREQVETAIRDEISSLVKPLKKDIRRCLFDD